MISLVSNQVSFEKFDVQCGDLVEKANESHKKLVQMETLQETCHLATAETVGKGLKSR